jgi:formylglycine-generating enzyme required for sulfatase activity
LPGWLWVGGAVLVLAVVAFILFVVLLREPGFTLVIQGAPPGSNVFIDNSPRGVTAADGSIRVPELKSGSRNIRVTHEGYSEFNTSVRGDDGDLKRVIAQMSPTETTPELPSEIDYNGVMILIPAGEFAMGDDAHAINERPVHRVTLPDFYIDKFEVTNAQYKKFCDATNRDYPTRHPWNERYFNNNPGSPVIGIAWDDADAYGRWAGKRLPTEQEWEKAASWDPQSRRKRTWPWGDVKDATRGNFSGDPVRIGAFPSGASAYGVQDMAGNASEWVADTYRPYPGSQAPESSFDASRRVVRGGGFRYQIDDARTSYREPQPADLRAIERVIDGRREEVLTTIGFRCAIAASDPRLAQFLRGRAR